jgi:predicted transcriptional regulator of viral defense system
MYAEPSRYALEASISEFERHHGVMRTSEALAAGIHRRTLYWMRDAGLLEVLSRGVYHLTALELPAKPDVVAVVRRVPRAVVCLVSALDIHELGAQIPAEVQIALPRGLRAPRIDHPRVRVFHMDAPSFAAGVEEVESGGVTLRVFSVAKTVADCFKYRGAIGRDVAIEALQEAVHGRRASPGEIMEYAAVDRVQNVVRPYLEALL